MKKPLEGITVIDLTEVWAGPMGCTLLGDLGAQVIRVESFPRTSYTRAVGRAASSGYTNNDAGAPRPWDRGAIHNQANRNKYSVTLNLTHPRGLEIFNRLIKRSDVFAEAYAAGTAEKLGIDYEAIKRVNPGIIMVSMPGWGVEGPYKGYVSLGSSLGGFSGHHSLRGYPDTDPSVTRNVNHTDAIGAINLAFAVLVALHHRTRTGEGQWIDISQVESFIPHLSRPMMEYMMNERAELRPLGNRDHYMSPHGCYRCVGEDNWVVITVSSDQEWRAFCGALGDPEWAKSDKFGDPLRRYEHQDEMDAHIQGWTRDKDKMEVMHLLQKAGVPAEAVMDDADLYVDPHLNDRGFFERVAHPFIGEYSYPGYLWKFSKMYEPVRIPPAGLGEHNDYVYGTMLGMSAEEVKDLETQGIIGNEVVA